MKPPASTRHFTGLHHYEGESSGPFSFLNPTTRRMPIPSQKEDRSSSQEESLKDGDGEQNAVKESKQKDEIRAEDVYRKWRSRDNRKGRHAIAVSPAADQNAKVGIFGALFFFQVVFRIAKHGSPPGRVYVSGYSFFDLFLEIRPSDGMSSCLVAQPILPFNSAIFLIQLRRANANA
jgi:hypothetical protein